MVKIRISLSCL